MSDYALVNKEDALARVDGDAELYAEILDMFFEDPQFDPDALRASMAAGDLDSSHKASHLLKGVAGTLGAEKLYHACQHFEDIVKGRKEGDALPAMETLISLYHETVPELHKVRDSL